MAWPLVMPIILPSDDGNFYSRYPQGNAPVPRLLFGAGSSVSRAASVLSNIVPSVPTQVQIILQGQSAGNQAQNGQPTQTSYSMVGWKSVVGATSYKIYRQVYNELGVITSAYSLYATVTTAAAAAAYSNYAANLNGATQQTQCDCAYLDTAATNITTFTFTTPGKTGTGPDPNGVFYPNLGYTYRVTAVVGTVESAQSADAFIVFSAGGFNIMAAGDFANQTTWNDGTCPVVSPLGYTTNALVKYISGSNNYIDWFTGNGCCAQNLGISGYNWFNLNVCAANAGMAIGIQCELAGDYVLNTSGIDVTTWGSAPTLHQWISYKIPLSTIQKNTAGGSSGGTSGNNVQQRSWYKPVYLNLNNSTASAWAEAYLSVN